MPAPEGQLGITGACGVGIVPEDCGPNQSGVAFAFTDGDNPGDCINEYATLDAGNPVFGMCWIVAQESAHNFGLDHEIMFLNGMSACSDPMTYQADCGGEKFFRNEFAHCSTNQTGLPKDFCGSSNECGTTQNSHQKLLTALGPGTPITTPPVVSIAAPPLAPRSSPASPSTRPRARSAASGRPSCGSTASSGRRRRAPRSVPTASPLPTTR